MSYVFKAQEFANKCKEVATKYKTLYVYACFGAPLNETNKKRYTNNCDYNKKEARKKKILAASADTFGFDCVNFIKGLLWGWNGDKNKTYGGAVYKSNGVPDTNADGLMSYCTGVSTNFKNIEVGEIVHMKGHVGVYIGNGLAAECTPIWKDGVQLTAVGNIGKKKGYKTRTWTNHGKLKFIDYSQPAPTPTPPTPTKFKVGDYVEIIGNGNTRSDGKGKTSYGKGLKRYINKIISGQPYPNDVGLKNSTRTGFYPDSSLKLVDTIPPTPSSTLKVGDKVKILNKGNTRADGKGKACDGVGWERYILAIYPNQPYSLKLGNAKKVVTGYYKTTSVKKV